MRLAMLNTQWLALPLLLSFALVGSSFHVGVDEPPDRGIASAPSLLLGEAASAQLSSDALRPTWQASQRLAGFSRHGGHYLYLESSRDTGAGVPQATIQLVDLGNNACLEQGCIATNYGESGAHRALSEAETSLLQRVFSLRQTWQLMDLAQGQRLQPISRSRNAQGEEVVTLQLPTGRSLELTLQQRRVNADVPQAAMQLTIRQPGKTQVVGSLATLRPAVLDYSIREVQLSPDGRHVAILVTALKPTFEGSLGTTLVQGFALQ